MNDAIAQSVLPNILPAQEFDSYYPGPTNCAKQSANVLVDNRFVLNFASPNGGASTFNLSPAQGMSDVCCYFKMGTGTVTNKGLPQAWGYSVIKQIQWRYANSTTYTMTGEQLYLQNLVESEDGSKRDQLAQLAGNAVVGAACNGAEAYVYINMPHNSPRASGKPLPLPTDLFVSPIVLTIELNPVASLFVDTTGNAGTQNIPGLQIAQLQVKQESFSNSANLLSARVDMNENSLTYPLKGFHQSEQTYNLVSSANPQVVNLVGFKSGMVKRILFWLTKGNEITASGSHTYEAMRDVALTYNGLQYYRADAESNQLWTLIGDTKSSIVNSYVMDTTASAWVPYASPWLVIDFAQVNIPYDREYKLVGGKSIMNASVQFQLTTPVQAADFILHTVVEYDSALSISRGGAEYVF
jgi:hypothetical protein